MILHVFFFCSEKILPPVISSVQLPSASSIFAGTGKIGQVFNNPFKVAETTKIASLEKHVKMVMNSNLKNIFTFVYNINPACEHQFSES